jgi:hypothetical protein
MSWDEMKNDIGGIWSAIKWTIIGLMLLGGGACLIDHLRNEWQGIF